MALRKSSVPDESSAQPPNLSFVVEMIGKEPDKSIDGQLFCIWQYRVSFSSLYQTGNTTYQTGNTADWPFVVVGGVALVFSSRLDIKNPDLYPECEIVQGISVLRPANDDKQYVSKPVQPGTVASGKVDIYFIAPCEED